jgi:hypothetical protein
MEEAIERSITVISQLGEDIPTDPSREVLHYQNQHTQSLIRGVSENDILNLPTMTNIKTLMIMKFLAQLQSVALTVKPGMNKFLIMKMVQLSMSQGLSPDAPFGFACFGSYLAQLGNISAGNRFILLARALLNKLNAKEKAGEVIAVVAEVTCFVEPLLAANELRIQGEAAALLVGDTYWACLCRLQYCADLLWGGTHLSAVNEKVSNAHFFIKQHEHKSILTFLLIIQKSVRLLLGTESETLTLNMLAETAQDNLNARHKWIL